MFFFLFPFIALYVLLFDKALGKEYMNLLKITKLHYDLKLCKADK